MHNLHEGKRTCQTHHMLNPRAISLALCGLFLLWTAEGSVVLTDTSNVSASFDDMEATFASRIPSTGIEGRLYVAEPLNACKQVKDMGDNEISGFLLIERGDCDFVTKVKHAQDAGYAAAIVYDDQNNEDLVTMSGHGAGIDIYAVFVAKPAGLVLCSSVDEEGSRCYVFPTFESAAKSFIAIAFIALLTCFAIFSTLFFVRRHRHHQAIAGVQPKGMPWKDVKALKILIYKNGTSPTSCAICLEDYRQGEKLRILPCGHEFHVTCIDQWLTSHRCFCPICKTDAHSKMPRQIPSEHSPLLASCPLNPNQIFSDTPARTLR